MADRFLVLWIMFAGILLSQDFTKREETAGAFFSSEGMEIIASSDRITVNHPSTGKVTQSIKGVKKFIQSPSGAYLVILSFDFQPGKSDYPVSLFLVSRSSGLIYNKTLTAPFDLPHPLFAVDDNGVVYSFEPLSLTLTADRIGNISEISIVEDAEFQMERTFFLKAGNGSVIGAVNLLGRDDSGDNILLFAYDFSTKSLKSKRLRGSTISGMEIADGEILLTTTRESESGVFQESRLLNNSFTESMLPAEPVSYLLTSELFLTRQGVIRGRDGSVIASPVLSQVKTITGVYTLPGGKKLLSAVTNEGNQFFIYHTATGDIRRSEGITAGKNSRPELFISSGMLFVVEDYVKTTIYQIN
ncbi:MAG: hypothetical protein AMXMBFR48_17910 [Ignavibacteriales bacterium]